MKIRDPRTARYEHIRSWSELVLVFSTFFSPGPARDWSLLVRGSLMKITYASISTLTFLKFIFEAAWSSVFETLIPSAAKSNGFSKIAISFGPGCSYATKNNFDTGLWLRVVPSHFMFKFNVGKSRIRHRTTLNSNDEFLYRLGINRRRFHLVSFYVGADSFRF